MNDYGEFTIRDARPGDGAAIAGVQVDSWRSTYKDIVDPDYLAALDAASRSSRWESRASENAPGTVLLVLEHDGVVAGFLQAGPSRSNPAEGSAELYVLYLLHEVQGRGQGTELFRSMRGRLQELGYETLHVWVLEASPAIHFYEKMGARDYGKRETVSIGARRHVEISMEWMTIY